MDDRYVLAVGEGNRFVVAAHYAGQAAGHYPPG